MTIDDYLALVTSEHNERPRYVATVTATVSPYSKLFAVFQSFIVEFDIDTAVGVQLDILGEWVGRSRRISTPLDGVYFAWDGSALVGWDSGVWKGEFDPDTGIIDLPDDAYRTLLKAKIAANSWDGTIPGAYDVWESIFVDSFLVIQDNQDMSMTVGIAGVSLSALDQALLINGYIPLKPAGVRVSYYAITPTPGKLFGWDVSGDAYAGWDEGQWAYELAPV